MKTFTLAVFCYLIFLSVLALSLAAPALSHEWYDAACCNTKDCEEIPVSIIDQNREGYIITINPRTHKATDSWTEPRTFKIPYGSTKIRKSQDENFHACISVYSARFLCLYVPFTGA